MAATTTENLVAVSALTLADPANLGFDRCVVDTGCGRNLVSATRVKDQGYEPDMSSFNL